MTIIAGIDPGKTGALVVLDTNRLGAALGGGASVHRVPLMKTPKEVPAWTEWARSWSAALAFVDLVVIEQVSARPTQGVVSMFTFGKSYGFAHALAAGAGVPVEFVTPAKWKAAMKLIGADKNASREKARQLIPALTPEFKG